LKAAAVRRGAVGLGLCLVAAVLAGCAGRAGSDGELKTLSDQTSGEKRAEIRMQLAVGYYEQGQYPVALDEIKLAIAATPDDAEAYGVRALIYSAMGEVALADENYQHAFRLAPGNPDISNNYGSFLCQNGRGAQAMGYFDAALKNRAYQSPLKAMVNAGVCSIKLKNFDAAERYLTDALRIAPDMPLVSTSLAQVYYARRDYVRAGSFISRVLDTAKMDSLSADVLWLSIRIKRKLGDRAAEASLGTLLRHHHPGSAEYAAFLRGAFDE
jgi:type IV pilus assembly protein PilF